MVTMPEAISVLYPNAIPGRDWMVVRSDGVETITRWNPALGPKPTQAQLDAVTEVDVSNARLGALYAKAKSLLTADDELSKKEKATLLVILDEFNRHADKINAMFAAFAAATSLQNLQTRMAAIGGYPERTIGDLRTAIESKIDAGQADG